MSRNSLKDIMSEALLEGMRTVYMVPFFVSTLCVTSKFGFSS